MNEKNLTFMIIIYQFCLQNIQSAVEVVRGSEHIFNFPVK